MKLVMYLYIIVKVLWPEGAWGVETREGLG
jgi:hypothetical protein